MRLFIAEKPSLGRAIAAGLGNQKKAEGCIRCGDDIVTWCFGHMLELAWPRDYKPEYAHWRREHLPIIPSQWKYKVKKDAAAQLDIIGSLLRDADSAVNAGDPDREGQLLVDEVLEHFSYKGKVQRIWLASLDEVSVKKALANLTDNARYAPLRDAARARSRADWLAGINATRALTIKGRADGRSDVLSLGRVQTPTLALVVARDLEISHFKPVDYFVLRALLVHSAGDFAATFAPSEDLAGLDSGGRLTDTAVAEALVAGHKNTDGLVTEATREAKTKAAPLPHSLSSLQKAASARLGMSAQQVLDTAQALYEKKLTTYPRTDCQYMASAELADAERIVAMLRQVPGLEDVAGGCYLTLKSAAWDDGKLGAHTALAPTGDAPSGLSEKEAQVYGLIATVYCLQFYPAYQYQAQKLTLDCQGTWVARGQTVIEAGWTARQADDEEKDEDSGQALPELAKDAPVTCAGVEQQVKKTSPPAKYTEGSLIKDMASVHRFITDPAAKAKLKETEGIGTEATRAKTIEILKERKYIRADGKALVSTELGQRLIEMTPPELKNPVTTAQWETRMTLIASG